MTDSPGADRNEQHDQTETLAERNREAGLPQDPKAAEPPADDQEPDTLRIVRAI